ASFKMYRQYRSFPAGREHSYSLMRLQQKMDSYIEFMSSRCGFYTEKLALNSHLAESETLSRAPVRQIVCLVIFSASQPQRYMKDYLDFLNQFDESVDQLLLYCNLSETETQIDQDLRNQFCSSAFPYRNSQELIKIAGIESFTNRVDPDTLALYGDFIYLNSRIQKPQALIVLNIKLESGKTNKSMHADWRRLLWLFDKLQFEVKDVQTDASSCSQLEECVKTFADSELHGDSCCLVVLSEGWLESSCIDSISKSMAFGKLIKGKPRLIIIQEYQPKSSEASDAAPKSLPQFLPDAVEAMRLQFRNDKPEVRVHPLSGTVWCQSEASDTESDNATPLIDHLRDFHQSLSHRGFGFDDFNHQRETAGRPTHLTMQGLAAESDRLRPILDQNNRPGVALILTEGLFDKVRDYQMFLDFAGFQVISERIDGIGASLREIVTSSAAQSPLAVVLIVKKHQVGAGVDD
uniref:TIR domain-containing protein n=1 Tax=Macrostomum lignano TaxID=282301 RepID=A0A1I8GM93_9PLAT